MLRTFFYFGKVVDVAVTEAHSCIQKIPTVDWIRGKVACTSVPIARLLFMLVTRLVCDREALNLLARVFVFSHALTYQIRATQEFQEVTNKKHERVMCLRVLSLNRAVLYFR